MAAPRLLLSIVVWNELIENRPWRRGRFFCFECNKGAAAEHSLPKTASHLGKLRVRIDLQIGVTLDLPSPARILSQPRSKVHFGAQRENVSEGGQPNEPTCPS